MIEVWLIIYGINATGNGWREQDRYLYADMAACRTALHEMRTAIPQGGDAEAGVIAFCWERQ